MSWNDEFQGDELDPASVICLDCLLRIIVATLTYKVFSLDFNDRFLSFNRRDFPGIRIGPEPTTDRFIAVMYDDKEGVIPGNALVVDPKKQFRPLSKYGNAVS